MREWGYGTKPALFRGAYGKTRVWGWRTLVAGEGTRDAIRDRICGFQLQ